METQAKQNLSLVNDSRIYIKLHQVSKNSSDFYTHRHLHHVYIHLDRFQLFPNSQPGLGFIPRLRPPPDRAGIGKLCKQLWWFSSSRHEVEYVNGVYNLTPTHIIPCAACHIVIWRSSHDHKKEPPLDAHVVFRLACECYQGRRLLYGMQD